MKKIIHLLAYALIIFSNVNITAMDEHTNLLAVIQQENNMYNKLNISRLLRSGNYQLMFDDEKKDVASNINFFITNQKNKNVYIYVLNNYVKEAISAFTNTELSTNKIIFMMNEPTQCNLINVAKLPENIVPVILCDIRKSPTYKNPVSSIPTISYTFDYHSVYLTHKNTGSDNLNTIIDSIKKSEKTPNNLLAIDLDTTNNIQKEPIIPKKVTIANQPYKYVPHAIALGLLLCILLYKSGATEKLLRFLH